MALIPRAAWAEHPTSERTSLATSELPQRTTPLRHLLGGIGRAHGLGWGLHLRQLKRSVAASSPMCVRTAPAPAAIQTPNR